MTAEPRPSRQALIFDALGLSVILLALLDYFRPSLLLLPTVAAGGDTPCHYPTLAWFHGQLLPRLRLHGWYPGGYLGHPLLLYYFPFPFLLMSALAPLVGLPAAFKLGTALGVFLLPPCAYACFRLLRLPFPAPLLGAAAATVFLFVEDNPIWGGTMASTLAGEFSYTYGTGLALVFLGLAYRAHAERNGPWGPAAALALTATAHGYAVLWAGISASFLLYRSRRPAAALGWLAAVAALAFALAAFFLVPLLAAWGWTTPYDDPWITATPTNLFPPLLWPLFGFVVAGLVLAGVELRRRAALDLRPLYLLHAALAASALALAGPALGIIDVRFVPFAQLAAALSGAATLGTALRALAAPGPAALALVISAVLFGDTQSRVLRHWIDWNYTGLEAKEHWPSFRRLNDTLRGGVADPRVAVEYGQEHEKAGSIRVYETLPQFSGRSTLEGVYNQASVQTHPVYYLASEMGATSPNPFRSREYSSFDLPAALAHLRLFNVREVVAVSETLRTALSRREDVEAVATIGPYSVHRLRGSGAGYVEPMAFAPVRSDPRGWREKAYRWFSRKPLSPAHLVFCSDARFDVVEQDEWLAPPRVPLPGGVEVTSTLEPERIRIRTSRVGHPLLVKVSYHPRWRAEGADGPYLVSPALMMLVPRRNEVTLAYGRDASDHLGLGTTLAALAVLGAGLWRDRRRAEAGPAAAASWRWGGLVPVGVLLCLAAGRVLAPDHRPPGDPVDLERRASGAFAEGRHADAAEYARHAARLATPQARPGLLVLRAEGLLRAGRPEEALSLFQSVVVLPEAKGHLAQALAGAASAAEALGRRDEAEAFLSRLETEFPGSPWQRTVR